MVEEHQLLKTMEIIKSKGNPILPFGINMCDCEAHVLSDGLLHVIGSVDVKDNEYCSTYYHHIYTSDMVNWTIERKFFEWNQEDGLKLYAPDFCEISGKIYVFFCLSDGREGYVFADDWVGLKNARVNFLPIEGIDPAVIVDGDRIYLFWGQFHLNGAELHVEEDGHLRIDNAVHNVLTEEEHYFHEGASIRKVGDDYYLLYASIINTKPTCLDVAVSKTIFGPYERIGTIIDNKNCDPGVWNNHGSIQCFKGQWYVFYHRSMNNSVFLRHLCVERIDRPNPHNIEKVSMSSNGVFTRLYDVVPYYCAEILGRSYISNALNQVCFRVYKGDRITFTKTSIKSLFDNIHITTNRIVAISWYIDNEIIAKSISILNITKIKYFMEKHLMPDVGDISIVVDFCYGNKTNMKM